MNYSSNFRKSIRNIKNTLATEGFNEPNHLLAGIILNDDCVGYKMLEKLIDIDDAKKKVKKVLYKRR